MTGSGSESEIDVEIEDEADEDATADHEPAGPSEAEWSLDQVSAADRRSGSDADHQSDAERLAEELGRTDLRTTEDGFVEARVLDLAAVDEDTVRLVVELPTGQELSFALEKPVPWSEEYALARLVEWIGYDAASIDHVVGERVLVDRTQRDAEAAVDAIWAEGAHEPSTIETAMKAFGLDVGPERSAEWRLVDPRELERPGPATVPELTPRRKLLAVTALTVLTFCAIVLAGVVSAAVGAVTVPPGLLSALAGLVTVLFVVYVALFVLGLFEF